MGRHLIEIINGSDLVSLEVCGINELLSTEGKARVNIIAMGDVGTNVLMGLRLTGGDVIGEIGIYDLNEPQLDRLEMEFNQMQYPPVPESEMGKHLTAHCIREMPPVRIIKSDEELLDCDVLVFCATKRVPEIGVTGDVRMMQLEANLELVKSIGEKIRTSRESGAGTVTGGGINTGKGAGFDGLVAVVSDPVDQLCMGMLESSGLEPGQVRGFGLGVMAARARYYAEKIASGEIKDFDDKNVSERKSDFEKYLTEGRAFGPHGQDLVIANSIDDYDDDVSRELTHLAVQANLRVRDLGFKPFLAPAISSAAFSIILTLRGEWNYGSVYFGKDTRDANAAAEASDNANANKAANATSGAYLGVLSRLTPTGVEYEDLELPEELYQRILTAYRNLLA